MLKSDVFSSKFCPEKYDSNLDKYSVLIFPLGYGELAGRKVGVEKGRKKEENRNYFLRKSITEK